MSNWAPIVHGRTYRVDYRSNMLVVPEWFGANEITWAKQFFRTATRSAESLDVGPRWLLFKNDRFLVAAVVCMADAVSANMNRDRASVPGDLGRRLYVGLGWVTTDLNANVPPMDLALFSPLYEYVRHRWNNLPPDDDIHTVYGKELVFSRTAMTEPASIPINRDPQQLAVWPDSQRESLWFGAASVPGQLSIALGLDRAKDAFDSPLLNVTVANEETRQRLPRVEQSTQTTTSEDFSKDRTPPRRRRVSGELLERILIFLNSFIRLFGLGERDRSDNRRDSRPKKAEPTFGTVPAGFRPKSKAVPGYKPARPHTGDATPTSEDEIR